MTLVGRTPRSAADALVGLVGISIQFEQRDQGVPRGPGGPPHQAQTFEGVGATSNHTQSPAFASLRTLRRIRSRFSALMCEM